MKLNYKETLYRFAFFFVLFPFFFKVGHSIMEALFYYVLVELVFLNNALFFNINSKGIFLVKVLAMIAIISLFAIIIPIIRSTNDFSLIRRLFSLYKQVIMGMALYCVYVKIKKYTDISFELLCVDSICAYVICSLVLIYIPGMKDLWRGIMYNQFEETTYRSMYQLRYGLCGYSGIDYSFLCSLGIVFCIILYYESRVKIQSIAGRVLILFIGNFLYARVGIVSSLIALVIGFLYSLSKVRIKAIVKWIVLFVGFALGALLVYVNYGDANEALRLIFEPVENFISTGEFSSNSTRVLKSMYIMPDQGTLLIGDGYYYDAEIKRNYMQSDVGFIRYMFFGGIFFEMLFYALPLCIVMRISQNRLYSKLSFILILVIVALFEMKGEAVMYMMATLVGLSFVSERVIWKYE